MAILRKKVLGSINGKYGDTVVQYKFGKDILYLRPEHYLPTNSQPLKNSRGRLGIGSQFASSLNSSEVLRQTWEYSKIKAISAYHKAIKYNIKPSHADAPSKNNIITPPDWVLKNVKAAYLNNFELVLNEKSIDVKYTQTKFEGYLYIEPPYIAVILGYLIYPKGDEDQFTTLDLSYLIEEEKENSSVNYNIELDQDMIDIIPNYELARFYFAIVRPVVNGEKPMWSSTKFAEKILQ
jgi:hypothetical protein